MNHSHTNEWSLFDKIDSAVSLEGVSGTTDGDLSRPLGGELPPDPLVDDPVNKTSSTGLTD